MLHETPKKYNNNSKIRPQKERLAENPTESIEKIDLRMSKRVNTSGSNVYRYITFYTYKTCSMPEYDRFKARCPRTKNNYMG